MGAAEMVEGEAGEAEPFGLPGKFFAEVARGAEGSGLLKNQSALGCPADSCRPI